MLLLNTLTLLILDALAKIDGWIESAVVDNDESPFLTVMGLGLALIFGLWRRYVLSLFRMDAELPAVAGRSRRVQEPKDAGRSGTDLECRFDLQGRLIDVPSGTATLTGFSRETMIGSLFKFIEPLGEALKEAKKIGLTVRDADDYLMAMHAPERNRVIAQRNPNMPDGGSGLTNRQAAQILAKYDQKKTAALDKIAQIVYRMNEDRLLRQETSGLISPQFAAAMRAQFKNYVPLKTLEEEGAMLGLGRGYELRNSGIEMAFGRQSKAGSPIAASMMDAARAVVMSEKAKVDRVVWNLANDPDVIDVMTPVDDANAAQHFSRQRMNPTSSASCPSPRAARTSTG